MRPGKGYSNTKIYIRLSKYVKQYMQTCYSDDGGALVFPELSEFYNCLCRTLTKDNAPTKYFDNFNGKQLPKIVFSETAIKIALSRKGVPDVEDDTISQETIDELLPIHTPSYLYRGLHSINTVTEDYTMTHSGAQELRALLNDVFWRELLYYINTNLHKRDSLGKYPTITKLIEQFCVMYNIDMENVETIQRVERRKREK